MIYVRRFIPDDLLQVMDMARAFHAESPVHSSHPFSEQSVINLLEMARASDDWLPLTATDDDARLTGFALVTVQPMFYSEERELLDLAVYVSRDRRGAATFVRLMARIEQWAKEKGAVVANLGINTGINHDAALRSFTKLGYLPSGIVVSKLL